MVNKYYQKKAKKSFKKKHVKDIKIFLRKKKKKEEKRLETDIKIFLEKKKKKTSVCIIIIKLRIFNENKKQKKKHEKLLFST